jgi:dynein heavy chain
MLEDVNNILNSGEIPNLFNTDEIGQIVSAVGNEAKLAAKEAAAAKASATGGSGNRSPKAADGAATSVTPPLSNADIFAFFVKKCARNLHVVLAFSPLSQSFRPRLRAFPALISCCYIDFFQEWPAEALFSVAKRVLGQGDPDQLALAGIAALASAAASGASTGAGSKTQRQESTADDEEDAIKHLLDPDVEDRVLTICVDMQQRAIALSAEFAREQGRKNYVTPTSYLQLLKLFASLLTNKRTSLAALEHRYARGVQSIESTELLVSRMQGELQALQPVLEASREQTAKMLVDIEAQQAEADATRLVCEREERICAESAAAASKMKAECEADLAKALPALEAAMEALKTLTKSDLVVVRSMQSPPNGEHWSLALYHIELRYACLQVCVW